MMERQQLRERSGPARAHNQERTDLSTMAIATAREVFDLLRDDLVAIEQ